MVVLKNTATNRTNDYDREHLDLGSYNGNGGGSVDIIMTLEFIKEYKYTSPFKVRFAKPNVVPDTPSGVSGGSKPTKITDGAVAFDGTNDTLSVPNHADFNFGSW